MAKTATASLVSLATSPYFAARPRSAAHKRLFANAVAPDAIDDDVETMRDYPETKDARAAYVSPATQRPVTEFQFRVYDACRQVPAGYYSTYKALAEHLGSGPRAVGNALARNPFCPQPIPCHRILPADCYIGGFSGDTKSKIFFKKAKLEKESLEFDDAGFLVGSMQQARFFGDFK
ncbi:hypothetical protein LPJ61_000030 [Coemansia biformis]|uniref:Methylated-DNA--protein-cysteine methyltransferase n=1 Tax=Coemansia biformis TaxID=1286918 RepID=A0A9W8CZC6_9FUNG|nr:hypothetical protein LPJ61_000030 [Coemansia biformis]